MVPRANRGCPGFKHEVNSTGPVNKTSMPAPQAEAAPSRATDSPALRLSALQAANFAGIGIHMPFMPAWLASQGLSDRQIGLTLAIGMIVRMLASQPIASLGDGRWGAARVLAILQALSAFGFLVLMSLPTPSAVIAAMAVMAVLSAGVVPLGDHLTTAQVRLRPGLDFARMRLWGSVSFLAMSTLAGFMVSRYGIGAVPVALSLCCIVAAAVALAAPETRHVPAGAEAQNAAPASPGRARLLLAFIVASALINASHAALYGFATLHWRSLGIDDGRIGLLWSASVMAEVGMLWALGRRASRSATSAMGFLAIAGLAALLRFALMPFATSFPAILALQLLHALSFGAQLLGVMALIALLAPPGRSAFSQGRLSAVNACMMGAATLLSGLIYERWGGQVFLFMLPVAAAGLVLLAITYRRAQRLALDFPPPRALPVDEPGAIRPTGLAPER